MIFQRLCEDLPNYEAAASNLIANTRVSPVAGHFAGWNTVDKTISSMNELFSFMARRAEKIESNQQTLRTDQYRLIS
jgi:hypothetical protein